MRKQDTREKKKRLFMSIFIVVIMTLSVAGFMIGQNSQDEIKYNDFKFIGTTNRWITTINNQNIAFNFLPSQVDSINVSDEIIERLKNSVQIDTTSYLNSTHKEIIALTQFELSSVLSLTRDRKSVV